MGSLVEAANNMDGDAVLVVGDDEVDIVPIIQAVRKTRFKLSPNTE